MRLILFITLWLCSFCTFGQKNFTISFTTEDYKKVKKNIPESFKDSISALNYLNDLRFFAIKKGYILASIDSYTITNQTIVTEFYLGEKISSIEIKVKEEDKVFIRKSSRISEKMLSSTPFQPEEISRILKTIHETSLSSGYPFSKVYLSDFKIVNKIPQAILIINEGTSYHFSKINIRGDSSISKKLISNLIDIKEKDLYDESKLRNISKRISQMPYLKEIKGHELLFTPEGVEVFLYLQSVPVSSASGVVGLQQNPNGKLGVTGEINVKLMNVFSRGELINFGWRSIQPYTQSLNTRLNVPFILKTAFGLDGNFQLFKRDSTFLEIKSLIGVSYYLKGGNYVKAYYQNNQSGLLNGAKNNPNFSNLSSISTNSYGISVYRRLFDYIPNPRKGFAILFDVSTGVRTNQINDTLPKEKSTTYRASMQIEWYLPLSNRFVFKFSNLSETFYAPVYFQNEAYRFGGQTTLRGFNEEEIFATTKSVFSFEIRYLLDKNSNLFAFYDQAIYENRTLNYFKDHPLGFGAGISFGTNFGIFSLSYALGKQYNNPILLSNGKIHFGYIAYF